MGPLAAMQGAREPESLCRFCAIAAPEVPAPIFATDGNDLNGCDSAGTAKLYALQHVRASCARLKLLSFARAQTPRDRSRRYANLA